MKIKSIVEDYAGNFFSAAEGERDSLYVIRWADFHTMRLTGGSATIAIMNGLIEMDSRDQVDSFLAHLDGTYESPEQCLRIPARSPLSCAA